mgnify:CR=1 FL=1
MRKETIPQLEKTMLFNEETKQKIYAVKALEKAKKLEAEKIKQGYKYITSQDGKTKTLTK